MDVMTLTHLANQTGISAEQLIAYRDRYLLYLPVIRIGETIGFLPEAGAVFALIHAESERGATPDEIQTELGERYPVAVIASQPIDTPMAGGGPSPVSGLLQDVDNRYRGLATELTQIREDLGKTASEQRVLQIQQALTGIANGTNKRLEPVAAMASELVQIRQAIGILAQRVDRQHTSTLHDRDDLTASLDSLVARLPEQAPGITDELNAMRLELAHLRSSLPEPEPVAAQQMASLTTDIASLKGQISDLRRERGQMISLMSALQDNLAQLHIELADARHRPVSVPTAHATLEMVSIGMDVGLEMDDEIGTGGLRTPRRLGHQGR